MEKKKNRVTELTHAALQVSRGFGVQHDHYTQSMFANKENCATHVHRASKIQLKLRKVGL